MMDLEHQNASKLMQNKDKLPVDHAGTAPLLVANARSFAQPLIAQESLETGENSLAHADGVAQILFDMGCTDELQAATYIVYAWPHLAKPQEVIAKAFGENFALLALETTRLVAIQRQAAQRSGEAAISPGASSQTENIRKMLLAFSRDLRVVLLRLASRLQTLRYYAATKIKAPPAVSTEVLQVFAPLANRLGIWQIKWELEDLAFRFTDEATYKSIAKQLEAKRGEREAALAALREGLERDLRGLGLNAQVQARPKHIYSIVRKMRGKNLAFNEVLDVRAMRIIVGDVAQCYAALARVQERFEAIPGELDDYIARPKLNGYQSLHTVVRDESGKPLEIQIRTQAMHDHAETGVAAHWAYKEAGVKGYAGVSAASSYDAKIAVLRQLLAWQREVSDAPSPGSAEPAVDDRIYVLTPDAAIVELPVGATPVDFAYAVHTNLGHRCRGARVDGALVPLNTLLQSGQRVEINAAKEGGPSRDWLNAELHFLASPRARAKVRAWFNALHLQENISEGRQAVEKLLQREGKTSLKHDDLAAQLGFKSAEDLFEVVGKDEFSVRTIEQFLRPEAKPSLHDDEAILQRKNRGEKSSEKTTGKGNVLVVGVDSLLTQLAKCCKPAPPDAIVGYVTRGRGVSIHRAACAGLKNLLSKEPDRLVEVAWGASKLGAKYAIDLKISATAREALLRDITEVFNKEKVSVRAMSQSAQKDTSLIAMTLELADTAALPALLAQVQRVKGVISARRI